MPASSLVLNTFDQRGTYALAPEVGGDAEGLDVDDDVGGLPDRQTRADVREGVASRDPAPVGRQEQEGAFRREQVLVPLALPAPRLGEGPDKRLWRGKRGVVLVEVLPERLEVIQAFLSHLDDLHRRQRRAPEPCSALNALACRDRRSFGVG